MMDFGSVTFGRETIAYEVRYSTARRTLAIEVHPNLRVLVKAPVGCEEEIIQAKVRRRVGWIDRQQEYFRGLQHPLSPRRYVSGETHLYLGRHYNLKVEGGTKAAVQLKSGRMLVSLPGPASPELVRRTLNRWYLDRSREVFGSILAQWAPKFRDRDVSLRVIVRSMRSRWGSLSINGSITLNRRLVRAPRACIEYVIVHELCHLRYRNHGKAFFKELDWRLPDWRRRKARLEALD
jgi:predicted metal-dependent hydrolase